MLTLTHDFGPETIDDGIDAGVAFGFNRIVR